MTAIDIPRERRSLSGWLIHLLSTLARRGRRRPKRADTHRLPDHVKRDIGLIDSAPPLKGR